MRVVDHKLVPLPLPNLEHGIDIQPAQGIAQDRCMRVEGSDFLETVNALRSDAQRMDSLPINPSKPQADATAHQGTAEAPE
jgi:hypothetical protein